MLEDIEQIIEKLKKETNYLDDIIYRKKKIKKKIFILFIMNLLLLVIKLAILS